MSLRMIRRSPSTALIVAIALSLTQCKTSNEYGGSLKDEESLLPGSGQNVMSLPLLTNPSDYKLVVENMLSNQTYPADKKDLLVQRLTRYLAFLGAKPDTNGTKNLLSRIFDSSTQYLLCDDFNDWACLETTPILTPKKAARIDEKPNLGSPLDVAEPLRIQEWYTNAWDVDAESITPGDMLAQRLAQKIRDEGTSGVSVAIYGIDEADRSMKSVYDALIAKVDAGIPVRGVFDSEDYVKGQNKWPLSFTYIKPASDKNWIFDMFNEKWTNIQFQYKDTTRLINAMNRGITKDRDAKARIEWPSRGIMHNKFIVFQKNGGKSVWTGTANVAETCMGTERNTNVGIFIDNAAVAEAFQAEFEEMFDYKAEAYNAPGKLIAADGSNDVLVGRFAGDKRPNTRRYFRFQSGEELRLHFAPTDDGEHRAILPLLLSARAGDVIRVSMFGGGGLEFVRAFQYAVSRGADIRIVFDRLTGSQTYGWLRARDGNLLDNNPYNANPPGKVAVRRSTWKKQNHHKSATLTRKSGGVMIPETIIIGSQNWSKQGNDVNDENMITIRRKGGELPLATRFNQHFDTRLWAVSEAGELKIGIPYKTQVNPDAEVTDPAPTPGADTIPATEEEPQTNPTSPGTTTNPASPSGAAAPSEVAPSLVAPWAERP